MTGRAACPCGLPRCSGWKAEVSRVGRWSWTLHVTHGASFVADPMWGPPRAFGSRRHAERKARRIIARNLAGYGRERFSVVPRPDEAGGPR